MTSPGGGAPHRFDFGAQGRGNVLVPFPVLRLGYESDRVGVDAPFQFARRPTTDIGRFARQQVGEPLGIGDGSADVVAARPQRRQKGGKRARHVQEVVRVAADIRLAAGFAPEGEHQPLVRVAHASELRPAESALHPPPDLLLHDVATARSGTRAGRRNHHGFEYAFALMGHDARLHAGRQTARRLAVVLLGTVVEVERGENRDAQTSRLVDTGLEIGDVEVFSCEQKRID